MIDVRLRLLSELAERDDLVRVSDGTRMLPAPQSASDDLRDATFVPRDAWRPATNEEWLKLTRPSATSQACSVHLMKVFDPAALGDLEALRATPEPIVSTPMGLMTDDRFARIVEALRRLNARLGGDSIHVAVLREPPGLTTISHDPQTGKAVGLHIDAWSPAEDRSRAPNVERLDVNLSVEEREFLFVPVSIHSIVRVLGLQVNASGRARRKEVAKRFLARFPATPVVKVRIPAGFAYRAPVEALIHDGGSSTAKHWSHHVAFEGTFVAQQMS